MQNNNILGIDSRIELDDEAQDAITGFEGKVVGITTWLNGCRRIGVQSRKLKDDKPIDIQWFDEPQVRKIAVDKKLKSEISDPGGPKPSPKRNIDPIR